MPTPSRQATIFFHNPGGYGWSESFWYSGPTDVATEVGHLNTLAVNRAGILTNSCTITHARIASNTVRNPNVLTVGTTGLGIPGAETPPTAEEEVALLARFNAGSSNYLRPFLRGIPSRVVTADGYTPDAAFTAAVNDFFNTLVNNPWNARGTLGSPTDHFAITSPTPNPPRGYTFTSATLAAAKGDVIRVHGARVPGYNGLKKIVSAGGTSYTVGGAAPAVADSSTNIYATKIVYQDNKIDSCQVLAISRRGAGRPFGLSRGRRATLYSLRQ